MSNKIDPSYLRYIHDGLNNSSIHPDNASSLPDGLTGLYDSSFLGQLNVNDSQKLLTRFAYFSLLKKEVSCHFVAIALNEPEIEIKEFVSTYSKWFNSAQVGKYTIYHERLKVYILSKLSENDFFAFNNRIIELAQDALAKNSHDEIVHYALEHLSSHLFVDAMITVNGEALKKIAYDNSYWNRQIEISKGFEWSKKMLNEMMLWASKYDDDQVIECGLNKVDLYHQEQNDASRIVELIALNEIDTALQRIESFGGNDKEGFQRKFILYMLCLMELTLLESKDKPFRKEAIEKLLKHFDDNLPVDHSVLNWNDFFSSYLVFLISVEIKKIDLDYSELYKRTENWNFKSSNWSGFNWIEESGPYTNDQIDVMINLAEGIRYNDEKSSVFRSIAVVLATHGKMAENYILLLRAIQAAEELDDNWSKSIEFSKIAIVFANQGQTDKAIQTVEGIRYEDKKSLAFIEIAKVFVNQGKLEDGRILLEKALQTAEKINDEYEKSSLLCEIAIELITQGKLEESNKLLEEAIVLVEGIRYEDEKSIAFSKIAIVFANQGQTDKAIQTVEGIRYEDKKSLAFIEIAKVFVNQGKLEDGRILLEKALQIAEKINDELEKSSLFRKIALILANQGEIDKATLLVEGIFDKGEKSSAFFEIAVELATQGNMTDSNILFERSIDATEYIKSLWSKNWILSKIAVELANQGEIEKAIQTVESMDIQKEIISAVCQIAFILSNQDKLLVSSHLLFIVIKNSEGIKNDWLKTPLLIDVAIVYANQNEIEKAIQMAECIKDEYNKSIAFRKIAVVFSNQGKLIERNILFEKAIQMAEGVNDEYYKSSAFREIAILLAAEGKLVESRMLLSKALQSASLISDYEKNIALSEIAVVLANQGEIDEANQMAEDLNNVFYKSLVLFKIANVLAKQGKMIKSNLLFTKAVKTSEGINNEYEKNKAILEILKVLVTQGEIEKAIQMAECIKDEYIKSIAFRILVILFVKQGKLLESNMLFDKAIQLTEGIIDDRNRSNECSKIAVAFANEGEVEKAIYLIYKINRGDNRMQAYQNIGKIFYEKNQLQNIHQSLMLLPNEEALFFYKRGMANAITATNANASNVLELLALVKDDKKSTAHILQMHALYLCFFENTNPIKMQRFNKTLNIQWALDITANFEKESARASHNVQDWINEIEDENDREDILSWVEKVQQEKMTEEKFLERIGKL